jgi:iron(III) transport system ATP-binding protein
MIRVADLVKTYTGGEVAAVDNISFTVGEGEFYTLLGPSGCGKTTTLRCIAGLERPDSGVIELDETVVVSDRHVVPTYRRDIGMVFQSYAVWPHMTVFENVAFPLRVGRTRLRSSQIRDRVIEALTLVGLEHLEKRMSTQLSGGQTQRLSLARAIVRQPKVLLLDEPLSNLDAKLRERMRGELSVIQRTIGITTLFVTHDQIEALSMSDRIAVMDQGKIVQEGRPEDVYHRPADEFVASFIGSTNLFVGKAVGTTELRRDCLQVEVEFGVLDCEVNDSSTPATSVVVAIRPEDILLHSRKPHQDGQARRANLFEGRVQIGLFTGTAIEYYLLVQDTIVQARVSSRINLRRGDRVWVEIAPGACRTFSIEGKRRDTVRPRYLTRLADLGHASDN